MKARRAEWESSRAAAGRKGAAAPTRRGALTTSAIRKLVDAGRPDAQIDFPVHLHMLRHATGPSWRTTPTTLVIHVYLSQATSGR